MAGDREFHKRLMAEALSERYGLALLDGDVRAAEGVVREAYDAEIPQAVIHDAVVAPAMHRIGILWERGEIGVAHEHMATQISLRVLALMRELFRVERARADQRVMLAAVQGEQHVMGLQMAGDLLGRPGVAFEQREPEALGQRLRHQPLVELAVSRHRSHPLLCANLRKPAGL